MLSQHHILILSVIPKTLAADFRSRASHSHASGGPLRVRSAESVKWDQQQRGRGLPQGTAAEVQEHHR